MTAVERNSFRSEMDVAKSGAQNGINSVLRSAVSHFRDYGERDRGRLDAQHARAEPHRRPTTRACDVDLLIRPVAFRSDGAGLAGLAIGAMIGGALFAVAPRN